MCILYLLLNIVTVNIDFPGSSTVNNFLQITLKQKLNHNYSLQFKFLAISLYITTRDFDGFTQLAEFLFECTLSWCTRKHIIKPNNKTDITNIYYIRHSKKNGCSMIPGVTHFYILCSVCTGKLRLVEKPDCDLTMSQSEEKTCSAAYSVELWDS